MKQLKEKLFKYVSFNSSIYTFKIIFSVYAEEQDIGSYWIGVTRINGVWVKTDGRKLEDTELSFEDNIDEGDCIIADNENDFKPKIVSCTEKNRVTHAEKFSIKV